MRFLLLLSLLTACTRQPTEATKPNEHVAELREKFIGVKAELALVLDAGGLPGRKDCDLTLWAGLANFAGLPVALDLFEPRPGEIIRRPETCWTEAGGDLGSKSTVSSDMIAGYMLGRWRDQDLRAFERLAAYGAAHTVSWPIPGWVMGQPYPSERARVVLRPSSIGIVGRAIYFLSLGASSHSYRKWIPLYGPGADSEMHVQAIGILLDGLVAEATRLAGLDGTVDQPQPAPSELAALDLTFPELEAIRFFVGQAPTDAFFHAILGRYTGDMGPAIGLLLDQAYESPSYVRGATPEAYAKIHWLAAARVVLDRFPEGP